MSQPNVLYLMTDQQRFDTMARWATATSTRPTSTGWCGAASRSPTPTRPARSACRRATRSAPAASRRPRASSPTGARRRRPGRPRRWRGAAAPTCRARMQSAGLPHLRHRQVSHPAVGRGPGLRGPPAQRGAVRHARPAPPRRLCRLDRRASIPNSTTSRR